MSIAYKYRSLPKVNLLIRNNMTINHLAVNYKKEGDGGTPWQDMNPQNIVGGASGNSNITIGTFDVIGDVKFKSN